MENRNLLSEMVLHGDSIDDLAEFLNINRVTLSRKIKYESDFKQSEMNMIRARYQMSDETFAKVFKKEVDINEDQRSSTTT